MHFIDAAVREGRNAVIEAGTGTGKTISSLCGVLPYVLDKGTKALYVTRTKSQQEQVAREAAAIKRRVLCVPFQGRSADSCPLMRGDPDKADGTPEELSRLCSRCKRLDGSGGRICGYYERTADADAGYWIGVVRECLSPEEFALRAESEGLCPYELRKLLLPAADIIAVPYPFLFIPGARMSLESWMGIPVSETVVVADEAHNLPDYLRDVQTFEISRNSLERAAAEARGRGDPYVWKDLRVTDFTDALDSALDSACREYLIDEDGMLPPYYLEEQLMERLGTISSSLFKAAQAMFAIGEGIVQEKEAGMKLPRSYIRSLGIFLQIWMEEQDAACVRLITGGDNPKFQSYCMDPSPAAGPLNACVSSVHISGTLEPLGNYADEMGLDVPLKLKSASSFPPGNFRMLYSGDVTMRYEERFSDENYRRLLDLISGSISSARVNTAVFFPSYQVMDRIVSDLDPGDRTVFAERRGMTQAALLSLVEAFRRSDGGILFGITGGRISEGIDFPGEALKLAIIAGIPFPKPSARLRALKHYYDVRFGDGAGFASIVPASRKVRQAAGRVIRSETDRGIAVIADCRAAVLRDSGAELSGDIPGEIRRFFSGPEHQIYKRYA